MKYLQAHTSNLKFRNFDNNLLFKLTFQSNFGCLLIENRLSSRTSNVGSKWSFVEFIHVIKESNNFCDWNLSVLWCIKPREFLLKRGNVKTRCFFDKMGEILKLLLNHKHSTKRSTFETKLRYLFQIFLSFPVYGLPPPISENNRKSMQKIPFSKIDGFSAQVIFPSTGVS